MKQLSDKDIAEMIGDDFIPDDKATKKLVRKSLHLSKMILQSPRPVPSHLTIDFHQHTEEQAWAMLVDVVKSGAHSATVITGASGILKIKFQQWVNESILSPYIISVVPINNGSFLIKLRKKHDYLPRPV